MMAADYQLSATEMIFGVRDSVWFPPVEGNAHYDEYLAWVEAGGVPDPYVPPEPAPPPPPEVLAWSDGYALRLGALSAAPGIGLLGWDADDPSAATTVFVHKKNETGSDISSPFLVAMQPGRVLRIEDRRNATRFVSHTVESVDATGPDLIVRVSPRNSGKLPFVDGDPVSLGVYKDGGGAAAFITSAK